MTPIANLQDAFLNHVRRNKVPVTVFLVNGVKLQGIITWFDSYTILLRRGTSTQLVFKHAVSTIMPNEPISLYERDTPNVDQADEAADDPAADEDAGGSQD